VILMMGRGLPAHCFKPTGADRYRSKDRPVLLGGDVLLLLGVPLITKRAYRISKMRVRRSSAIEKSGVSLKLRQINRMRASPPQCGRETGTFCTEGTCTPDQG
jgi:hypothetical protein